jgi:hypothetical protein
MHSGIGCASMQPWSGRFLDRGDCWRRGMSEWSMGCCNGLSFYIPSLNTCIVSWVTWPVNREPGDSVALLSLDRHVETPRASCGLMTLLLHLLSILCRLMSHCVHSEAAGSSVPHQGNRARVRGRSTTCCSSSWFVLDNAAEGCRNWKTSY